MIKADRRTGISAEARSLVRTADPTRLKIELIYLPAYSPNLNLIERLWRHVKHEVLYSRYYDSLPKFKTAIMGCINATQSPEKKSLSSLFSLKFQIIEKSQIFNE